MMTADGRACHFKTMIRHECARVNKYSMNMLQSPMPANLSLQGAVGGRAFFSNQSSKQPPRRGWMEVVRAALLACLSLLIVNHHAHGQTHVSNARALGMGGAYLTQAFGAEAVRWNPATLGLRSTTRYSLMFASFGLGASNNAFNSADYNRYNGAKLSTVDKQTLLQRVPLKGWDFHAGSGTELLGFSFHNFAAMISMDFVSDANLPRDVIDLLLNGNQMNRIYDFSRARGSALAFASVGVAYGHAVVLPQKSIKLALGGTIKYLRGLGMVEMTEAKGQVRTTLTGISGDASAQARAAEGGNGFGLDLGATALLRRQWRVGITLRNVFATIGWQRNVRLYEYGVHADSLTLVAVEEEENAVFGNTSESRRGGRFSTILPPVLHLGVSRAWPEFVVSADVLQGMQREYGITQTPELRAGVELNFVPGLSTRVGINAGGNHKIGSSLGVGLHAGDFHFDLAAGALGGFVPLMGKGLGVAMSMRVVR